MEGWGWGWGWGGLHTLYEVGGWGLGVTYLVGDKKSSQKHRGRQKRRERSLVKRHFENHVWSG